MSDDKIMMKNIFLIWDILSILSSLQNDPLNVSFDYKIDYIRFLSEF